LQFALRQSNIKIIFLFIKTIYYANNTQHSYQSNSEALVESFALSYIHLYAFLRLGVVDELDLLCIKFDKIFLGSKID